MIDPSQRYNHQEIVPPCTEEDVHSLGTVLERSSQILKKQASAKEDVGDILPSKK